MVNYLEEQYQVAEQAREFLITWGLKQKFVAETCQLPAKVFSKFLTHRLALSKTQTQRVVDYMADYAQRNG